MQTPCSEVLIRNASYDYEKLRPLVFELLGVLDGGRIGRQSRVLIKPNFLAPAPPDRAMITHPLIVRAVAEYVLEKGGAALVSDSPAMGTFERVMREGGFERELKDVPVVCRAFGDSVPVDVGPPFNRIEIAADAMNADVVINLPKLKTHAQMLLTLGVKNMFGCIVGMRKPEWHFRTGIDRDKFAELLVRVCAAVRPSITILDGILAMEGQGPGKGGVPRELNVVLAADTAFAIDAVVCRMLGLTQNDLPTSRVASGLGLVPHDIRIDGDLPDIRDMKLPVMTPLVFGPKGLHGFMRKHLVQRPVCNTSLCRHCGECWRYCPAKAIVPEQNGPAFDYDKCIRCYCCIEVCPYGALAAKETAAGKVARMMLKR
ncbi:MAG TPA: DUF362 domain-containing protein [Thermodesulfovibrionales bacterium]|nr:DUF362 domain-containing protein [Thermodesulfovibrionales bacterium]